MRDSAPVGTRVSKELIRLRRKGRQLGLLLLEWRAHGKLNGWMRLIMARGEIAAYNDVTIVLEASDGEDSLVVK